MKIALYYPWVYLTSGAERVLLELAQQSRHEWTIYTNRYESNNTYPGLKNVKIVELSPRISVNRAFSEVIKASISIIKQKLPLHEYDALFIVCEGVGDFITINNSSLPTYCICLTPLRPVFDMVYRARYLKEKGALVAAKLGLFGIAFKFIDRLLWKKYRRVFCISQEVRKRVIAGGLAGDDKIEVIYPGINYSEFEPNWNYEKYFMLPGRIMWTKNIQLGIEGFKLFLKNNPEFQDFRLIVTGIVDKKSRPYFEELKSIAGGDKRIEFIEHPTDEELFALYKNSYSVLFTAFNEDWGIVPLEGMAYGKPVISVNSGGPTETVEHDVNGFLAPPEPEAFADAMRRLASDPDRVLEMGRNGVKTAAGYDWSGFVGRVDEYLEEQERKK